MKKEIAVSIAALFAATSIAAAQTPKGGGGPGVGGGAGGGQQTLPNAQGPSAGPMGGGSGQGAEGGPGGPRSEAPADAPPSKIQEPGKQGQGSKRNAEDGSPKSKQGGKAAVNEGKEDNRNGGGKQGRDTSKSAAKAESGGGAVVPEAKRPQVKAAFSKHRVAPASNLNISVNVGVSVPRTVRLYPVPEDVVVIYPAYRRYKYFFVDDRICLVDPVTYAIVDIIIVA